MNLRDLKALIDSEPANAARTDAEILAWLETKSLPGKISAAAIADIIFVSGKYPDIVLASQEAGSTAKKKSAIVALAIINVRERELDYSRAGVVASLTSVLDSLLAEGLISAEIRGAILTLGANKVSPVEKAKFPPIKLKYVTDARGLV